MLWFRAQITFLVITSKTIWSKHNTFSWKSWDFGIKHLHGKAPVVPYRLCFSVSEYHKFTLVWKPYPHSCSTLNLIQCSVTTSIITGLKVNCAISKLQLYFMIALLLIRWEGRIILKCCLMSFLEIRWCLKQLFIIIKEKQEMLFSFLQRNEVNQINHAHIKLKQMTVSKMYCWEPIKNLY